MDDKFNNECIIKHWMLWYDAICLGFSILGGICYGPEGISLIEDRGLTFWVIAAIELGHK